ncbi:MAG: hypothetical protein JXR83_13970 [Deltaproteobacteria bacterium]|nr:hypothetical protein [Deltaproteobacteria bacterium]
MAEAISLKTLDVDWTDLEIAFRDAVSGVQSYLDLGTGEVLVVIDQHDLDADEVASCPDRFLAIPAFSTSEGIEVLREFIVQLPAGELRGRLEQGCRGAGGLKRCFEILAEEGWLLDRFTQFEEQAIYERLHWWLTAHGIRPQRPPPRSPRLALVADGVN